MRIAILGPKETECGYSTKRILKEAKGAFKEANLVPVVDVLLKTDEKGIYAYHDNKDMAKYDYVIPRIDSKRAQVGYPVMRFLDELGVKKPYVAETIQIAHNKFITLERLAREGIRIPETYLSSSKESSLKALKKIKLPSVIKLLSGFGGEGVLMVDSEDAFRSIVETMNVLRQELLVEAYVPNPGEDIRGIVAGNEVIASYKRRAAEGEKKANIHLGGNAISYKMDAEMEDITLRAAKAIKSDLCAVDMIMSKKGPMVIEVNINFGLRGIEKTTDINVARRIIEFVKGELKR